MQAKLLRNNHHCISDCVRHLINYFSHCIDRYSPYYNNSGFAILFQQSFERWEYFRSIYVPSEHGALLSLGFQASFAKAP